ncbi:MAG: hypothetical protein HYS04_07715 [Acidobacteria bacterium]|nr:hypothetical protein [Acidobacteriota bacterium]
MADRLVLAAVAAGLLAGCARDEVATLWREPPEITAESMFHGPAGRDGAPRPPFHFREEVRSGTAPKIVVQDARGVVWRVKFGHEVRPEVFATRLAWACGYFAEPVFFVASARIEGARKLGRARYYIHQGEFVNAAFETTPPGLKYLGTAWNWNQNPFSGTRELKGLKILMMLVSNWDNKDKRNWWQGSNTGMWEGGGGGRLYYVTDWGQSMGAWGGFVPRDDWDCERFRAQTPEFVSGIRGGKVQFGFTGQHTEDFKSDITVEDIRWLMRYLARISDAHIRSALRAAGADAAHQDCFTRALRSRIEQLRRATHSAPRELSLR